MKKFTLICIALLMVAAGCKKSYDGGTKVEVNTDSMGPVANRSVSDLNEQTILGDWSYVDEWGDTIGFVFNPDGTEGAPGEYDQGETVKWRLEGNVLIMEYSYSGTDEGMAYSESEVWVTTAAIVDGEFYISAVLRMEGSGDSLDGEWVLIEQERETATWGDENYDGMYEGRIDLTITGETYSLLETYAWTETESGWGTESDSDKVACSGTVATDGNMVILIPDTDSDDECDTTELLRVGENVIIWEWNMYASDPIISG